MRSVKVGGANLAIMAQSVTIHLPANRFGCLKVSRVFGAHLSCVFAGQAGEAEEA